MPHAPALLAPPPARPAPAPFCPLQVQVEFDSPKGNDASVVYYGDSIYTLYNASRLETRKGKRVKVEPLQVSARNRGVGDRPEVAVERERGRE